MRTVAYLWMVTSFVRHSLLHSRLAATCRKAGRLGQLTLNKITKGTAFRFHHACVVSDCLQRTWWVMQLNSQLAQGSESPWRYFPFDQPWLWSGASGLWARSLSLLPSQAAFINSPTGPMTTHFWGPVANWGLAASGMCTREAP